MSWIDWAAAPWIAVFFAILYQYANRRPRLVDYEPLTSGPLVSIIIPARDEAKNIERCVRSVLATRYAPIEVIVVDDRSSDGTADIVEPATGGRLRLVRGAELPPGWFGKSWAIIQGYRVAKGDLLLFTDADTKHEPDLVPRALRALRAEAVDLLSVLPRQEMRTFWERLIQPHVFVALASWVFDVRRVNRTRVEWRAIANGQFILTTRAAYERAGTHEAVKESVAEDMRLAQRYVRAGLNIFLTHAREFMTTRMYGSLREIVEGWSKNLALGAPHMAPPLPGVRAVLPYVMWVPALFWIIPPAAWLATGLDVAGIAAAAALASWVVVYLGERAPVWYALLYPLGAAIVALIMIRSALRGARKVEWRGRVYRA